MIGSRKRMNWPAQMMRRMNLPNEWVNRVNSIPTGWMDQVSLPPGWMSRMNMPSEWTSRAERINRLNRMRQISRRRRESCEDRPLAIRWLSFLGGSLGPATWLTRRPWLAATIALGGVYLLARRMHWDRRVYETMGIERVRETEGREIRVEETITINRPVEEVYAFWRNLENLPALMRHLDSVTVVNDRTSHWVAKAPLGIAVEWNADIVEDRQNEAVAWRSQPGAQVPNSGRVSFRKAPGNRGTELRVIFQYQPPAGELGAAFAKLLGAEPGQQVRDDLRRLKNIMETGVMPTTEGQPSGRRMFGMVPGARHRAPAIPSSREQREAA